MPNGPRPFRNSRPRQGGGSSDSRSRRWGSNGGGNDGSRNSQNAQKNYERYLALAQAEVQAGDVVAAENYFQHAEHFYRSMRPDPAVTQATPVTRPPDP